MSDLSRPSPVADAGFRFAAAPGSPPRPSVLLIHGLAGTPKEMRYLGWALSRAGFDVHGVQLAGHCGREADLLRTGWRDWERSVEAAYEAAIVRSGAVLVAGLCLGALLALRLAARHPATVRGVALCSATLWYDGWTLPWTRILLPALLATPLGKRWRFVAREPYGVKDQRLRRSLAARKHRGDSVSAGSLGLSGASLCELAALTARVKRDIPRIATPALIMHAIEDDIAGLRTPRHLARRLAGPVRTVLLDDSYHMITIDRQRGRVAAETIAFFSALSPIGQGEESVAGPRGAAFGADPLADPRGAG